ncbi:TonB-dependent receptor [Mitsuaria sp. WAJ17]|uniref:TonB-dependent receptor n=1 Tax=Mitsuaria sp. WAJ17 TaxID=2761452 RepID=UPI0016026F4F|nr:TonB-dependent receptor [Mitsuaria sp. WAJ17]MBB2485464.1 TonB-dependent receptor [Mitsuaria sp. WAJ17]
MTNKQYRSVGRLSLMALAVGMALGSGQVHAQSNASGQVYGELSQFQGATVLLENLATGAKRTLVPGADGRVVATNLPVGSYRATLIQGGKTVSVLDNVEVRIGQGTALAFGTRMETVTVTGSRKVVDTSTADVGTSFNAQQLAALPVARNLNSIILLAPGTTEADSRYSGGISIGGGAPSENAFYINGFPATNPLTQLGSAELPFGAIADAQVLSGGFGAQYGRSIGGVMNIITKSGTNNWEGGMTYSVMPNSFRNSTIDLHYATTGAVPNFDNQLRLRRSGNTRTEYNYGAYVGGPIIKDRLFMFAAVEKREIRTETVNVTAQASQATANLIGFTKNQNNTLRALGKLDFNITDEHRVDLTLIRDKPEITTDFYGYNYTTGAVGTNRNFQAVYNNVDNQTAQGADIGVLRYTGELTSDLSLVALVGKSKTKHTNVFNGPGTDIKGVVFNPNAAGATPPGMTIPTLNPIGNAQVLSPHSEDTVKSFRLDLEYRWGKHTIKAGVDNNKLSSANAGVTLAGGSTIRYIKTSAANAANTAFQPLGGSSDKVWLADPSHGPLAAQGFYGREEIFTTVTDAYSNQSAQYIEDTYQFSKGLSATLGLRRESYENLNGDKEKFLEMKNQTNPRLSIVWDPIGDASTKIYGSAGRYSIQIPTHIAVRGASRSTFTRELFTYTGVDANGMPTGRINIARPYSANNEYGQAKDSKVVSAINMKPSYQDELTLGFEKALATDYRGSVKFTHRSLKSTIDDTCDAVPFERWAEQNKVDVSDWDGFGCASFNPGATNTFLVDFKSANPAKARKEYTTVTLTAADFNLDKPKRTYTALDFTLEHPFRNGWYGRVTYTLSKNKGNTEGQTLSDVAQTDVAATQTWDHWELMKLADGYLPGDRRHMLRANGFMQLGSQWEVGGTVSIQSGRPINCLGYYAEGGITPIDPVGYGSSYHYCDGKPAPRGTAGRTPWTQRLDVRVTHKPKWAEGLELSMDIFNVTNQQVVQNVIETYNGADAKTKSPDYGRPISTTTPRRFQFTATYNKKF